MPSTSRLAVPLLLLCSLPSLAAQSATWETFIATAAARHGAFGERAARFLAAHAPERDRDLDPELLATHLDLALAARSRFPWARELPVEVFLNDVLPYAIVDETREDWRTPMFALGSEIVAACSTAAEAAQALNRALFDRIGVHYDTGRKKPNQSLSESIAQGKASCSGLSIALVNACRAVGVPARIAGVASWHDKRGNHTWVEIFDGERWRFTGADEYDPQGLDRGWFVGDAAQAKAGDPRFGVFATSWARLADGASFPMVWAPRDRSVPGVDVTPRYAPAATGAATQVATRFVRVVDRPGGERLVAEVGLVADGRCVERVTTRAGRADWNDMPALALAPGAAHTLTIAHGGETRTATVTAAAAGSETLELVWSTLAPAVEPRAADGLSEADAEAAVQELFAARAGELAEAARDELDGGAIRVGDRELKLLEKTFGEAPAGGRSLWISMHGGGGTRPAVNDGQWRNQIRLYTLDEGLYIAPRAPTDTWNLWHEAHIDDLFDRLIDLAVAARGVDPNRVFLLGYSAGGDGVYQLAPRMADRFAAAAMMAGHPNDADPLGLRNLPFAIFMGGKDSAYRRNEVAAEWGNKLEALAAADPGGYPHRVTIYPEHGHWMQGDDKEALPWMAEQRRDPWPRTVVWRQAPRTHERFYWLAVAPDAAKPGATIRAAVDGATIRITATDVSALTLRLRDGLVDLDAPITVVANGETVFQGRVPRTRDAIRTSLEERCDPASAATATLSLAW